jgi:ParB family chromosome partitioning protein
MIEEQLAAANSVSQTATTEGVPSTQPRTLAGPVRTMGLTLDKIEGEARELKDALAKGHSVIELDPSQIEPSFISDRFEILADDAFQHLKKSMQEHGQEVPVLVRPHPSREGCFQLAYGHRRWRASKELGVKLKAVVRSIDDQSLILAQGLENSARSDLTYIERAMFARTLEDRGTDRQVIMTALSTDKTELSKMISVARSIPEHIARGIGPAPKAGRRRWLELGDHLSKAGMLTHAERLLADPDLSPDSDIRFLRVLAVLAKPVRPAKASPIWKSDKGRVLALLSNEGGRAVVRFEPTISASFAEFVGSRLGELFGEFEKLSKQN